MKIALGYIFVSVGLFFWILSVPNNYNSWVEAISFAVFIVGLGLLIDGKIEANNKAKGN